MTAAHPFSRACRITLRSSDLLATQKEQHPLLGGVARRAGVGSWSVPTGRPTPPLRGTPPRRGCSAVALPHKL